MPGLRLPVALSLPALALALAACGSGTGDAPASSPATSASSTAGASPSTGGIVPDAVWAQVIKKAVAPLESMSDGDVVTAAKKVCSAFEASPDKPTAQAILADHQGALGLDAAQSQVFATAAVTHFCTGQVGAWTRASLG